MTTYESNPYAKYIKRNHPISIRLVAMSTFDMKRAWLKLFN